MLDRKLVRYIFRMERRLKLNALNLNKKEDYKKYKLRRDNKRGIKYVERDDRIRQKYFRVWTIDPISRENIYANTTMAFVLEEQSVNIGVKGWFLDTRDDPFGVHGIVEGTRTTFERFINFVEDWKDEQEIDFYLRRKPGYIKHYTFPNLAYVYNPYEADYYAEEEIIDIDMFGGRLNW